MALDNGWFTGEHYLITAESGSAFTLTLKQTEEPQELEILSGTKIFLADTVYGDFLSDWRFLLKYADGKENEVGFYETDNRGNTPAGLEIQICWDSEDGHYATEYSFYENSFEAGTYTVEFTFDNRLLGEETIVFTTELEELESYPLNLNSAVTLSNGLVEKYSFIPEKSGIYNLMSVSGYADIQLYDGTGTLLAAPGEAAFLTQGETYYYVCRAEQENTILELILIPVFSPDRQLSLSEMADMTKSNHECYTFALSIEEEGTYSIESDDEWIEILSYMRYFDGTNAGPAGVEGIQSSDGGVVIEASPGLYLPTIYTYNEDDAGSVAIRRISDSESEILDLASRAEDLKNQLAQTQEITEEQRKAVKDLVAQTARMDSQALADSEDADVLLTDLDELVVKAGMVIKETAVTGDASQGAGVIGAAAAAAADSSLPEGASYQAMVTIGYGDTDYSGGEILSCNSHEVLAISMSIVDGNTGTALKEDIQPALPVQITVAVPQAYQGKEFALYHIVDGAALQMDYRLSPDGTQLTFVTTSFSDFVLVLTDCGEGKHSLTEKIIKQATCTEKGEKEIRCTNCTYVDYLTIETAEHTWTTVTDKNATCGAAGTQHKECSVCHTKGAAETIPATGRHSYTWVQDKAATCASAGSRHEECVVCHGTGKTETIPMRAHTYKIVTDRAPTCADAGSQHKECTVCGRKEASTPIGVTSNHVYKTVIDKAATCGAAGSQHRECTVCGKKEASTPIAATNRHTYKTVVDKAATCTDAGSRHKECTVCGWKTAAESIPSAGGHKYKNVVDNAATCGAAGSQHRECTVCGAKEAPAAIAATNKHNYKTVVDKAATCGAAGSQHRECTVCGKKEAATAITATGKHNYKNVVEKKATCAKAGSQHQECTVCGSKQKATSIKATGKHRYGSFKVTRKATVLKSGRKTRTCKVCGKKETRSIAKLKATIKVAKTKLTIGVKQTVTAPKVTYRSGDGIRSWTSSRKSVATVDKKGRITGKKTGTATITVKLKSGKTAKIKVTVKKKISTTKLTVNRKSLTLKKGKTYTLKVTVSPEYSQDKVAYKSSNKTIATVNSKGRITAKKKGTAKITIQSGKKKVTCKVKVK